MGARSNVFLGFSVLLGPIQYLADKVLDTYSWWKGLPWWWLFWIWAAFVIGQIVGATPVLWQRFRARFHVMQVETVARAHQTPPGGNHEWKEITIVLRFSRALRDVTLQTTIDYAINLPARRQFTLQSELLERVHSGERKRLVVAIIPVESYNNEPLGYPCWGNRFRESGDVEGMEALSAGTDSIVTVEVLRGPVTLQRERIFLSVLGEYDADVFLAWKGQPAAIEVLPTV